MKSLELTFKSTGMRLKVLRLKAVNTDLTAEDVQDVMQKMSAAKLFAKASDEVYATPVAAHLGETTKPALVPVAVTVPTAPEPTTPETANPEPVPNV